MRHKPHIDDYDFIIERMQGMHFVYQVEKRTRVRVLSWYLQSFVKLYPILAEKLFQSEIEKELAKRIPNPEWIDP